jgi:hypothetical protein
MQPLRKDHVDHYKEFVKEEFSNASKHVEQEITQQAYDKVEEVGTQFAKELKLEKLISEMGKRDKALRDFQSKKQSMEYDLQRKRKKSLTKYQRFLIIKESNVNGICPRSAFR